MSAVSLRPCPAVNMVDGQIHPQRQTILFVDDEERILRSLRMLFAAHYRVLVATNGHDALEILKRDTVHVLVSDQRMPHMTGVELLRQAREVAPATLRLLLTGYADLNAMIGSVNEGEVFRYISKPWSSEEIRQTIAQAMEISESLYRREDFPATASVTGREETPTAEEEVHDILLIDEAPEIPVLVRTLLNENHPGSYRMAWASTLEEALEFLERRKFAVVISEIHLHGEDVAPFLKTLKRYHPQVVTIVLTSFQDTTVLMDLINQGQIHRFLPKPVRKTLTVRGIQSGIERHRQIRQRPELARRHRVDAPRAEVPHTLVNRIRGLFMLL